LAWEGQKATCDFASPLFYRGYVYYVSGPGVVYCVDAATGKEVYSERVESGQCWATPMAFGDYLYVFGKNGIATILKAGPKFEKIATNRLWNEDDKPKITEPFNLKTRNPANQGRAAANADSLEPILYGAIAVDGDFYVRLGSHLYCIR
jgi:outer membrane protein assembly factor BamB